MGEVICPKKELERRRVTGIVGGGGVADDATFERVGGAWIATHRDGAALDADGGGAVVVELLREPSWHLEETISVFRPPARFREVGLGQS